MTSLKLKQRQLVSVAMFLSCCISLATQGRDCDNHFQCNSQFCKCDDLCHVYDDCCAVAQTNSKNNDTSLRDSCHVYEGQTSINKFPKAVYMIDKCMRDWQDITVRQKCENTTGITLMERVPVSDPRWSLVFLNKYCARCNRVAQWIPWTLIIATMKHVAIDEETPFTSTLMEEMQQATAQYSFVPSTFKRFRSCYPLFEILNIFPNITECSTGSLAPIMIYTYSERFIVRNQDCFDYFLSSIDENETPFQSFCFALSKTQDRVAMEYTVDLAQLPGIYKHDEEIQCRETEIFLSPKDGCEMLFCPQYYIAYLGNCVHIDSYRRGYMLDILFQVNGTVDLEFREQIFYFYREIIYLIKTVHLSLSQRMTEYTIYEGIDAVTDSNCSLLSLLIPIYGAQAHPKADSIYHALSEKFRSFSIGNLQLKIVTNVSLSTCKSRDAVREPLTLILGFRSFKKYNVPCASVMLVKHMADENNNTDFTATQPPILYSLKSNKTFIDESAVIHIGNRHFICVDDYVKKPHNTASSGSVIYPVYNRLLGIGILLVFSRI